MLDQTKQKKFQEMVKEVSPNSALFTNCAKAFAVGGGICVLGQALMNWFMAMNASQEDAGMYTSVALIFLGVLLTGLGVYDKIGKFAGAGSIVPITGFANAVAAPAIEFKREGHVMGIGAKMFVVAGPVIVFGLLSSVLIGFVYYVLR